MKDLIIIGAGGIGKETALLVEQINETRPTWNIIGFLDDKIELHDTCVNGYKVLGKIDAINNFDNTYVVCAMASYEAKRKIIDKIEKSKVKFANIIHPSVYISPTNFLGKGIIIYPGVIMTTNIKIGDHVVISPGCGIGHETVIEDFSSVLWNVNLSGNVRIEMGCLLGTSSSVLQNIKIGMGTIVGAGAVVVRDLPQKCTAVGVPARVIKMHK